MKLLLSLLACLVAGLSSGQVGPNTIQTPIPGRLGIIGNQLAISQTLKLYGTTLTFEAAMPADAATADATMQQVASEGYNLLRLHHVDQLAKTRGWGPIKFALDSAQKNGIYVVVTLTSEDATPFGDYQYFKRKCLEGGTEKDAVAALASLDQRTAAFFRAVGDHPALLAVEPLNEEDGDPATYPSFTAHMKATFAAAGYKGLPIFKNAGVSSAWSAALAGFGLVSVHGYGDDAREGDPQTKYFSTLWAEQPWQWGDAWNMGPDHPRGLLEVGSLFPNPLRLENELWLCAQAKANGFSAICWFLWASNAGMLGKGPFLERYAAKEPLRAVAEHLGRYVFLDPSPVKTFVSGRETSYITDQVRYQTSGDPWGERKVVCIVSADGLPIATSSHLFITGGGVAQPTGFVSSPLQDDGKYLSIGAIGSLPFLISGGGPVRFTNSRPSLKAFYFDPLTRSRTGPALIQKVSPTDWTVYTSGGLEVEVIAG